MSEEAGSPRKKQRHEVDPALIPEDEAKVMRVAEILAKELNPPVKFGDPKFEQGDHKLWIRDAATNSTFTFGIEPGAITVFFTKNGTLQILVQAPCDEADHVHHGRLEEVFKAFGGGNHTASTNKTDYQIGPLWVAAADHKELFEAKTQNLGALRKLKPEARLKAIANDMKNHHVNMNGDPEGMKSKATISPSTIAVKRKNNGEGKPTFTLTVTYRLCSKDADREAAEGLPLPQVLQEYLAANAGMALDLKKSTPFATPSGKRLSVADLVRLPWVETANATFLKTVGAGKFAVPSLMASSTYGRFILSFYVNEFTLYGIVKGSDDRDGPKVDADTVSSVYANVYG